MFISTFIEKHCTQLFKLNRGNLVTAQSLLHTSIIIMWNKIT